MTARNWVDPLAGDGKDRSHVLSLPYWTLFVRIAQIVLALLLLILTAFSASKLGSNAAGFGLTWFTFILTVIYFVYLGVSLAKFPIYYHPLAHLPFEILINIFWLCSWAVLASEAASVGDLEDYIGSYYYRYLPSSYKSALNALKASAALGAIEWVLFCITLAFLVIAFINSTKSSAVNGGVEAGVEPKATELNTYGGEPTPAGYPAQPQQTYDPNVAPAGYAPQHGDPYGGTAPPSQPYDQHPIAGTAPTQHPPA